MPFELKVESKEPAIFVLDLSGEITSQEMLDHLDAIDGKLKEENLYEDLLYLVVDARGVVMSFIEALKGSTTHQSKQRGSSQDPKTYGMFVVDNRDIDMLRDLFRKANPNADIPMFSTTEKAVAYIHDHVQMKKQ